jgi:hypothetical protein
MGYREMTTNAEYGQYAFRAIEVAPVQKDTLGRDRMGSPLIILVGGEPETLRFVQENLHVIVNNVLRVKKMKPTSRNIEETAQIFERNLQDLFTIAAQHKGSSLLSEMSLSLKKALLILAVERYRNDRERICRIFGITPDKLEQEMVSCGLL